MTRLDQVRELTSRGYRQAEIARELGLKSARQVSRLQRQAGIPARPRMVYTPEMVAEIKRLSGVEGWPPEEIAATLNLNYVTVLTHAEPGAGVEWRDTASWLTRKHHRLFRELRRGIRRQEEST